MNASQPKYNDIPYFILPKDRVVSSFNCLKGNNSPKKRKAVPLSEKYTLSIEEASQYFGIGHVRLRNIIHANPNADFFLMVGNRLQIKRKKFEKFIDDVSVI